MKKPYLVIMAAGMGSRYGGLKQIDKLDREGHIIIDYSIYDALNAGFRDITFIIKHEIEREFREVMDKHLKDKNVSVHYAYQELDMLPPGYCVPEGRKKPWGTAHAISCLNESDSPFAVINADDYYGPHAFNKIYSFLEKTTDRSFAMVAYRIANTVSEYGSVSRGICRAEQNMLTEIVEHTDVFTQNKRIYYREKGKINQLDPNSLVSMNLWGFTPSFIRECRDRFAHFLDANINDNPMGCEFYIPKVVSELIQKGRASVRVLESEDKWQGITYREDKANVVAAFEILREKGIYPNEI